MKLTKFIHATFSVEHNGTRLLFDPGVLNEGVDFGPEYDAVFFSHNHADHFSLDNQDQFSGKQYFANYEVASILQSKGKSCTYVPIGETVEVGPFTVTPTYADHKQGIETQGYLITCGQKTIWFLGDTFDLQMTYDADIVLCPIGGLGYTFDAVSGAKFVNTLDCSLAIPIHYEYPGMTETPEDFISAVTCEGKKMENGDVLDL